MKKKFTTLDLIKKFIPYYKKYRLILILDLVAAMLTIVADISLPLIIRNITNIASKDISKLTIKYILIMAFIYLILKLIEILSYFFMQKYGHIMGAKIEKDMRKDVFSHIQYLSDEYFATTKIGQLLSRVTTDLFDITEFAHHCPEEFLVAAVKVIVTFIILFNINSPLTLVIFTILPLMFIFTNATRKKIRYRQSQQRYQIGEINSSIEDSLMGIKVIKSFANEELEINKFDKDNFTFLNIKSKFYNEMAKFTAITKILDTFMYLTVVIVGGILLINGKINVGDFILYTMYTTTLLASVSRLINFIETFEKGLTGIERFTEIMNVKPEIKDSLSSIELKNVNGNIQFKNVYFSYKDRDDNLNDKQYVLENINLNIRKGEKIAIVGPSGVGKTTLTNLIPRFYDVDYGEILIDNKNIKDLKLKSLRHNIGVVQQEVYLFSGTIFENIVYGKLDATREDVFKAAELAGAIEFIEKLPNGIDTYVGERGVMLSGGQKQRISIARVFLKNPPILILDEATSALDNRSEKIVQDSLERLSHGRTTITIAHRLTTIINSDKIIVLTEEGIKEIGSHKELLEKKGEYFNLYNKIDNHIMG